MSLREFAFQACSIDHSDISPFKINHLRIPDRAESDLCPERRDRWIQFARLERGKLRRSQERLSVSSSGCGRVDRTRNVRAVHSTFAADSSGPWHDRVYLEPESLYNCTFHERCLLTS